MILAILLLALTGFMLIINSEYNRVKRMREQDEREAQERNRRRQQVTYYR